MGNLPKRVHSFENSLADSIHRAAGSMTFVYIHILWFGAWILFSDLLGDPFPYGLLTMVVSLEAIFLSTFIMVSQNRQTQLAEEMAKDDDRVEEAQEDLQESFEDLQDEFDEVQKDLEEIKKLIQKIETVREAQKSQSPA